jgi:hypothetical protein
MRCNLPGILLALTVVVGRSAAASATDDSAKGAARDLANEAKRDFDAGRFEAAGRKFQRAYEIAKVPTLAIWAARALVKRGQLVSGSELYRQAIRLAPNDLWVGQAQQQAQTSARKELDELQVRIPRLRIRVEGAAANDVEIAIDGVKIANALFEIEMPTDPGRRSIVGKRGPEVVAQTIDLAEGDHNQAVLKFTAGTPASTPASAPSVASGAAVTEAPHDGPLAIVTPPSTETESGVSGGGGQRTWGWIAVGVGAAGLLTGAVTGIVVLSNSGLRNDCHNDTCDASKSDKVNTYNLMRNLSTAGFIVAGVGATVGVTLLLWTPKHRAEPRVALQLAPGSAGITGAF